jgi:hypothetical protein
VTGSQLAGVAGHPTYADISDDGESFEYDAAWVDVPARELETLYAVVSPGDVRGTETRLPGPPPSDWIAPRFLEPVDVTVPPAAFAQGLHDPVTWTPSPSEVDAEGHIGLSFELATGKVVAEMIVSTGETEFALPRLPGEVEETDVFDWPYTVRVYLRDCPTDFVTTKLCDRVAWDSTGILTP